MESCVENTGAQVSQLNALRRQYSWDGEQKIQKWSKDMLQKSGREEGLLHLPRQLTAEEQESEGGWRPKNTEILKEIARKFPGFAWWVHGQDVKTLNYPTVRGENPTLFDLLIIPPDLADGYGGYSRAKEDERIGTLRVGEGGDAAWVMKTSNLARELPKEAIEQSLALIEGWQGVFPHEPTFVKEEFGIPSLLVRIDCVINEGGELGVYEIEERPAGVGITTLLNTQFRELFAKIKVEWPQFSVVVSPKRQHKGDDYLWVSEVPLEEVISSSDLVLVRAEPEEYGFRVLVPRSISTVTTKGMKSYGVSLGLWQKVDKSYQHFPWKEGFCLKLLQGSKLRGIAIWDPVENSQGASSKTEILDALALRGEMYLQPLIRPMRWDIQGKPYDGIFRTFFGYNPKLKCWVALGGSWNARPAPCLKIHGTSETIIGPAILSS